MSFTIIKLADEPILIVNITGELTPYVHYQMSVEVAKLLENVPGVVYRINDTTRAQFSLTNTIRMLDQAVKGWPGTASDPRMISLMVMNHGNAFLGISQMIRDWAGGSRIHSFMQLSDALAYARAQIAGQASVSSKMIV